MITIIMMVIMMVIFMTIVIMAITNRRVNIDNFFIYFLFALCRPAEFSAFSQKQSKETQEQDQVILLLYNSFRFFFFEISL